MFIRTSVPPPEARQPRPLRAGPTSSGPASKRPGPASERPESASERPGSASERPGSASKGPQGGGMDGRTDVLIPPVFYMTSSLPVCSGAAAQKKEKRKGEKRKGEKKGKRSDGDGK